MNSNYFIIFFSVMLYTSYLSIIIDMDKLCEDCVSSPMTMCVYFGCVLLLLILCVYHLNKLGGKQEHYTGVGLGHGGGYSGQTSGSTVRTLGQEFSGTNQLDRSIISNAEIAQVDPSLSQVGRAVDIFGGNSTERLVNERGEPDFWEISSELGAYKQSQTPGMRQDAQSNAAGKERFRGRRERLMGSLGNAEDDSLGSLLLR